MGVLEQNSRRRMYLGQEGNQLTLLMIILAVIFILFKFTYIIFRIIDLEESVYYSAVHNWLLVPGSAQGFIRQPWSILTYWFMENGVLEMVVHLLWLWSFGYILQDLSGNNKIIPLFLYGSFFAGIVFVGTAALFPGLMAARPGFMLKGATTGIMAVAIATTTLAPGYRLFPMINGGIPLWVLTTLFVVIDFAGIPSGLGPVYLAHLAAAATGFLFVHQLRRGRDWSAWMNNSVTWVNDFFNPDKPRSKKSLKDHMFYKSKGEPYKKIPHVTQQRIDAILDKISQKGVHLLTDEEREILRRASEED